ncbi:MAG: ribosome biogenesis GTPase YlqF, partial [Acholeplasmataceae bacterium]|nr:ribosome biogenesis GTPase YlqF [Acholeplasmataceae bacterium]
MNKQIQWFPGHMFKSLREIREKLSLMDIVLVLLDARLPKSSMNPELFKLIKNKPILILLNKMDLADENELSKWISNFNQQGFKTLKIDSQTGKNVSKIHQACKDVLKEKLDREKGKGLLERPLRTMILGIPNVGKSTLINQLTKSSATRTGNTPGVTKAQQWIKINTNFELLDTPGVLWPKFEDKAVGYHLAITGAIKDKILPEDDICHYALEFLSSYYPKRLFDRYKITPEMTYIEKLDTIGRLRGAILKGSEI